jgi:hypothetical protein
MCMHVHVHVKREIVLGKTRHTQFVSYTLSLSLYVHVRDVPLRVRARPWGKHDPKVRGLPSHLGMLDLLDA